MRNGRSIRGTGNYPEGMISGGEIGDAFTAGPAYSKASKVVPIDKLSVVITLVLAFLFLHEEFMVKSLIGCVLIGAGTLMMVL